MCQKMVLSCVVISLALLSLGSIALAGDVIYSGVDAWITPADGSTRASFKQDPIPAGFFCKGSEIFDGVIAFKGEPVVVSPDGSLGGADTIVLRTADAPFNARMTTTTLSQVKALQLVSIEPIETSCGRFDVAVTLNGEQPLTEMSITEADLNGGTYSAPLTVRVTMAFTPVELPEATPLVFGRVIDFMASPTSRWQYEGGLDSFGSVEVDTDGDRMVDDLVVGTSNFSAGFMMRPDQRIDCEPICHCDPSSVDPQTPSCHCTHLHCIWPAGCQPITYVETNGVGTAKSLGELSVPPEFVEAAHLAACD